MDKNSKRPACKTNEFSIAGFCISACSMLLLLTGIGMIAAAIAGTVLAAIGRAKAVKNGAPTALATAGVIVGVGSMTLGIIIIIFGAAVVSALPYYL